MKDFSDCEYGYVLDLVAVYVQHLSTCIQGIPKCDIKDGNHGHISLRPAYMEFEEFLFWMGTALLRRNNVTFPSRLEILHHFLGRNLRCVTNSQKLSAKQWMSSITLE